MAYGRRIPAAFGIVACFAAVSATAGAQESGIVVEAALALAIEDRTPVDTGSSFPADVGRVWLWTKVSGAAGQTVTHVWSHGENEWVVPLQIGANTWRTWSNKTIPAEWTGEWQVEVRDQAGNVLKTVRFTVGSGG
ncbi:MAG: DUF2914 domain-containing protein [Gemmatimonadota bacterium]|nr:MAG: DUF2914 domain-containing protein [Gemmatimonadota bacterium]